MPLQSGRVSKLRLYKGVKQAKDETSQDITLFLAESELWILSRISHHESETGLKQVYTVHPFLELGDLERLAILILNHLPLETLFQTFAIIWLSLVTASFWLPWDFENLGFDH